MRARNKYSVTLSLVPYISIFPVWNVYDEFGSAGWLCFEVSWGKHYG